MKSESLGFKKLKNGKEQGFEKYRIQIRKDIDRVNWPWNKILEKYENEQETINPQATQQILEKKLDKYSFEDFSEENIEEDDNFALYGQGLDNIDTLTPNQLYHLKSVNRMLSKTVTRILEAYAMLDPEIGYVQGMHSIAVAIVYNYFLSMVEFYKLCKKISQISESTEEFPSLSPYQVKKQAIWKEM